MFSRGRLGSEVSTLNFCPQLLILTILSITQTAHAHYFKEDSDVKIAGVSAAAEFDEEEVLQRS